LPEFLQKLPAPLRSQGGLMLLAASGMLVAMGVFLGVLRALGLL
jgi:hypothetical protein